MKYWDSSALLPLLVNEPSSEKIRAISVGDPTVVTCWGSPIECLSALHRRKREGVFSESHFIKVMDRFHRLMEEVDFVIPTNHLRDQTFRLLSTHS